MTAQINSPVRILAHDDPASRVRPQRRPSRIAGSGGRCWPACGPRSASRRTSWIRLQSRLVDSAIARPTLSEARVETLTLPLWH